MRRITVLYLLTFLVSLSSWAACQSDYRPQVCVPVKLERVVDGDTIVVRYELFRLRVRLLGVNTPELGHGKKEDEPGAVAALRFTEQFVSDEPICIEPDGEEFDIDPYGRVLAYLWRTKDMRMLNAHLVLYGHARVEFYGRKLKYRRMLLDAERCARENCPCRGIR